MYDYSNSPVQPSNWTDEEIRKTINFDPLPQQLQVPSTAVAAPVSMQEFMAQLNQSFGNNTGYNAQTTPLSTDYGNLTGDASMLPPEGRWDNTKAGFATDKRELGMAANKLGGEIGANVNAMSFAEKGSALLGGVKGVWDAYNAHKTNKLAKEQLAFTKDSFNRNFTAQAKTTNAQLADRQNARHKRDPNTFASVSDYMKKYGV